MLKGHKIALFVILLFSLLASRNLFKSGYFPMHDDLQMMRQLELEKCFLDGQIPCRWVPDMGYGFGVPLFNFYPPLPYLIGETFRILGFAFTATARLTFALSIIASGITMYFLAKEFFGRIGGVLSSIFYIWAPYHAVDVYVRGAMNEAWALTWFPLIFLFSYRLITNHKSLVTKNVVLLALSYAFLLMSHNLMVLIFTPFFGIWVLLHLWQGRAWSRLPHLVISGIWAFGLSAFFTLPALTENGFTQIKGQLVGYYDYTAHFVSLNQLLISRFWGYGPSVWVEADDGMSFQIGHLHWILSIVVGLMLLVRGIMAVRNRNIKKDQLLLIGVFLFFVGWFASYMTHLKSFWIYRSISQLSYIQFPWRFLTITTFAFSFLVGFLPGIFAKLKSKRGFLLKLFVTPPQIFVTLFLAIALVILNWGYFKVERTGPVTDEEKFSGEAWRIQQTAGIYDYLPIYAKTAPTGPQTVLAEFMDGEGNLAFPAQGTYWGKFIANVESEEAKLRVNILYFPGWKIFLKDDLNIREVPSFIPEEERWGRMWINLPKGEHLVYAQFFNTPVRTYGNIISLGAWFLLISSLVWKKKFSVKI